jgi:PAS domain-containing protein
MDEAKQIINELLQVVMNSITQGIYVVDLEGNILFCNQAMVRLYGEKAMHGNVADIQRNGGVYLPDQVTPWPLKQMPIMRILAGGPPTGDLEYVRNAQKPEGTWVMVYAYLLRRTDGTPAGGVAVVREVFEASAKGLPSLTPNVPTAPL